MRHALALMVGLGLLVSGCGDSTGASSSTSAAATSTTSTASSSTSTSSSSSTPSRPADPLGAGLQDILDAAIQNAGPGISLAVILPGRDPWLGVAGVSEPGVPVTTDMAFGAGSITKNFIAALVLQLADEGRLSLDDPLGDWLPAYPNIDGTATIRQLLSHTGGLFSVDDHPGFWTSVFAEPTREWTDEELIAEFQAGPLSAPGTEWHYSNTGYLLLGEIVEEATGSTVSAELRDRFCVPLGLTSAFYLSEEDSPGEVAEGWFDIGRFAPGVDDQKPADERFSEYPYLANLPEAGGLFATPDDLAKWMWELYHERTVLNAESLTEMLDWVTTPIPPEEASVVAGYGLGTARFPRDMTYGATAIGHGGGAEFYSAAAMYLPEYGVAIGAAQNSDHDAFGWALAHVVGHITDLVAPLPATAPPLPTAAHVPGTPIVAVGPTPETERWVGVEFTAVNRLRPDDEYAIANVDGAPVAILVDGEEIGLRPWYVGSHGHQPPTFELLVLGTEANPYAPHEHLMEAGAAPRVPDPTVFHDLQVWVIEAVDAGVYRVTDAMAISSTGEHLGRHALVSIAPEWWRCEIDVPRTRRLYAIFDGTHDPAIGEQSSPLLAMKIEDGRIDVVANDLVRCVLHLEGDFDQ